MLQSPLAGRTAFYPRLAGALLLLTLLPLAAGCDSDDPDPDPTAETTVKVMTRNLYLGGDLFTLLDPNCGTAKPVPTPLCVSQLYFGNVVSAAPGIVTSDIPARMDAVAAEIEANAPDLVGLQEVSWYRRQIPGDYVTGTTIPNATETTFDFLQILMDALEARGLAYEVVATNTNADVEFPSTLDGINFTDLRLTDRDVVLARIDTTLQASVVREANFDAALTLPIMIGPVEVLFTRGFSEVAVTKGGVDFTFVNTHLEVGGNAAPFQVGQAQYLTSAAGFSGTEPLIILGDFNADPNDDTTFTDAYATLTAAFTDAWATLRAADAGFTCCQAADLRNDPSTLDARIDLVLYQGNVTPLEIGRVGEELADRTATGLWPSDHAGVVATLRVTE